MQVYNGSNSASAQSEQVYHDDDKASKLQCKLQLIIPAHACRSA